jgi:hypothetical protein
MTFLEVPYIILKNISAMAKRLFLIVCAFVFLICVQCGRNPQLNTEEKVQDFEFLYRTLEENYPYFVVARRQYSIDWLSKKDEYLERIKNTPNDSAFYMTVSSIVNQLQCPHLGIVYNHEGMLDVYKRASIEKPKYAKWADTLEK